MTITDVTDVGRPIVLIPLGSYEQHGPHLPADTDTVIAVSLCRAARDIVARRPTGVDCVVAPPLGIGASGEHAGFTATLSMGTEVLAAALVEIVRSSDWTSGVIFVNGHGGNHDAIARARRVLVPEGRPVDFWSPSSPVDGDLHAGHTETSVMLALEPERVRLERVEVGNRSSADAISTELRDHGVRFVSTNGVLGDPTGAEASIGRSIFDRWVDDLCRIIERRATTTP